MVDGTEPAEPERPGADETIVLPRIPSESARTTRPVGRDRDEAMRRVRAAGMTWARDVARAMDEVRPNEATEIPTVPEHRRRWGRGVLLAVLCAVVVLALGGGTVWALRGHGSAPRNPTAVDTGQPTDSPSPVPPSDSATPSAAPSASATVSAGTTRTGTAPAKAPTKAATTHPAGNGAAGGVATTPPAVPSSSPSDPPTP